MLMYALVGRIRMISSEPVLTAAEKVAQDIVECYKRPPMTFEEFQKLWGTRSVAGVYQRLPNGAAEHVGAVVALAKTRLTAVARAVVGSTFLVASPTLCVACPMFPSRVF